MVVGSWEQYLNMDLPVSTIVNHHHRLSCLLAAAESAALQVLLLEYLLLRWLQPRFSSFNLAVPTSEQHPAVPTQRSHSSPSEFALICRQILFRNNGVTSRSATFNTAVGQFPQMLQANDAGSHYRFPGPHLVYIQLQSRNSSHCTRSTHRALA